MRIIKRIQAGKYTRLGVSKKGNLHVGYWDDTLDDICWAPLAGVLASKRFSREFKARIRVQC